MKDTVEFLKLLNEHIPLNRAYGFKGNHGITLKEDKLYIGVWVFDSTRLKNKSIGCTLSNEDLELSPLELVLKIKNNI